MREHLDHHPTDPETGEYHYRRDWHYEDKMAWEMGMPYAFADGYQNEMVLSHVITNWMGDDGFIKKLAVRDAVLMFHGDVTRIMGKVTKKYVENDEHLVDVEMRSENLDGSLTFNTGVATVRLVSKEDIKY